MESEGKSPSITLAIVVAIVVFPELTPRPAEGDKPPLRHVAQDTYWCHTVRSTVEQPSKMPFLLCNPAESSGAVVNFPERTTTVIVDMLYYIVNKYGLCL